MKTSGGSSFACGPLGVSFGAAGKIAGPSVVQRVVVGWYIDNPRVFEGRSG